MKTKSLVQFVALILAVSVSPLFSADGPRSADTKEVSVEHGFLGVVVASAHPSLAANLKGVLNPEQGLTVEQVAQNSPAMKAGIKLHDVLTAYDNQKLLSTEQFGKLVHTDRPGRDLSLEILRNGKLEKIQVTLGKLDPTDFRSWEPSPQAQPFRFGRPDRVPRHFQDHPNRAGEWDSFDALTVKKLGDDKFHAELQLIDRQGKTNKHVFEGSREEIRAGVEADQNLRPAERAHLLRSLNLHTLYDDTPFPHIWFEPGMGWFFEQPGGPLH